MPPGTMPPGTMTAETTETRPVEPTPVKTTPEASDDESVFDPHALLGVSRGAAPDVIEAAYRDAKMKYDPDLVEGLGHSLQEHYRAKARAIDEAYERLRQSGKNVAETMVEPVNSN